MQYSTYQTWRIATRLYLLACRLDPGLATWRSAGILIELRLRGDEREGVDPHRHLGVRELGDELWRLDLRLGRDDGPTVQARQAIDLLKGIFTYKHE